MYVAALHRRPHALNLGLAVGLYTACIAAGNGLGALFGGWLTDTYGFFASFSFTVGCYGVGLLGLLLLSGRPLPAREAPAASATEIDPAELRRPVWMLALLTAFSLSSINMVFDILFPVYSLRAGMSFTLVGTLSGVKMVLAAMVRPFSGALMARLQPLRMNHTALVGLGVGTMLIPLAGLGWGLTAVIALLGVTFGSVRTTSATLAIINEHNPKVISRRVSYYNTCLTLGQVISPWFIGLLADRVEVFTALVVVPACFLGLYGIGNLLLPRLAARFAPGERGTLPL
jgi:MFS family permease